MKFLKELIAWTLTLIGLVFTVGCFLLEAGVIDIPLPPMP